MKTEKMFVENVTIMKYRTPNNQYKFEVLDKFDEPDEVKRFDKMLEKSKQLKEENKLVEQLWIKNTVIV